MPPGVRPAARSVREPRRQDDHMFESIQRPQRPRPRILFLLSIGAHAVALVLLVASGLWRVDKLEVADSPLMVAAGPGAPMSAGPEEEADPERKPDRKKNR